MSSFHLRTRYTFHPVGQGLFTSGSICLQNPKKQLFNWVFDCGTTSKPQAQLRARTMNDLRHEATVMHNGKPRISLVAISHFDKDHINGLVSLLEKFSVSTLLLPYMPLWERLVLAFDEGLDSLSSLMPFFVNPVDYITNNLEGAEVGQIVFVPGSGGEGNGPPDEGGGERPPLPEGNQPLAITIDDSDKLSDEEHEKDWTDFNRTKGRINSVIFLRKGGRIRIPGIWEFVPYNDAEILPKPDNEFKEKVEKKRKELLNPVPNKDREIILKELEDIYNNHFGDSSEEKNIISLFLYAGPIGTHSICYDARMLRMEYERFDLKYLFQIGMHRQHLDEWPNNRLSLLYTGDGYLDTPDRLDRMISHMKCSRIKRLACVQVMHHGSAENWHPGLAKRLAPNISVFSSDPAHKRFKHPHGSVVRDFLPYGPIQVDTQHGLIIIGHVTYP